MCPIRNESGRNNYLDSSVELREHSICVGQDELQGLGIRYWGNGNIWSYEGPFVTIRAESSMSSSLSVKSE
jgi:hypothetical protein